MRYQRGMSLMGMLFWGILVGVVGVTAARTIPAYTEYYKLTKDIKATASQVGQGETVADVKRIYSKYAEVDQLSLSANDLDISKEGGVVVISFAYEKRIPLFANISLLIDFKGSSSGK